MFNIIKDYKKNADIDYVTDILWSIFIMLKKITTPSTNRCESVELILRGAKKRRTLAYANANMVNSDAGIKANLSAVK